jgi:hypothetical protein
MWEERERKWGKRERKWGKTDRQAVRPADKQVHRRLDKESKVNIDRKRNEIRKKETNKEIETLQNKSNSI